jgi:hypothetical protein
MWLSSSEPTTPTLESRHNTMAVDSKSDLQPSDHDQQHALHTLTVAHCPRGAEFEVDIH